MAATITIEDTKQLGYQYAKSQEAVKVGIDLEQADPDSPVYKSTNMFDYTQKVDVQTKVVNPIDESSGITITTSTVTSATQNSDINLKNPVHKGLVKISNLRAGGNLEAGTNIPVAVIDNDTLQESEGKCNIEVDVTTVGGQPRSMVVTFNFIGGLKFVDFTA